MIAVIFELQAADGQRETYLDLAADLKPLLAEIDGFISIERFQSLADPQRLLSLSFWRDEAAVQQWRNVEQHRAAQKRAAMACWHSIACGWLRWCGTMVWISENRPRMTAAAITRGKVRGHYQL